MNRISKSEYNHGFKKSNFVTFSWKMIFKIRPKRYKATPMEPATHRLVADAFTDWAMQKDVALKYLKGDFIIYFKKKYVIQWRYSIPPKEPVAIHWYRHCCKLSSNEKEICSDRNCLTRAQVRGHSSEVWEHGMAVARWNSFCEGGGSRGKQQWRQSERKWSVDLSAII